MDSRKRDARYISEAVGCVLLCAMLLLLLTSAYIKPAISEMGLICRICIQFLVFTVPAAWGVWMLRRSRIVYPHEMNHSSLDKAMPMVLSSFGVIIIVQMLYISVFPTVKMSADIALAETPAQIFLLFLAVSIVPALAEEILFRGFMIKSLRLFRRSLSVLMSALAFALMRFSVTDFPLYFVCGLILGMAYLVTGSLKVSVAVHFLCNAFWFLAETVGLYMPEYETLLMRSAFAVCVFLSVSGIPFLTKNMRVFFEGDDERAASSSYFWSLPTALFVLRATVIQIFLSGR